MSAIHGWSARSIDSAFVGADAAWAGFVGTIRARKAPADVFVHAGGAWAIKVAITTVRALTYEPASAWTWSGEHSADVTDGRALVIDRAVNAAILDALVQSVLPSGDTTWIGGPPPTLAELSKWSVAGVDPVTIGRSTAGSTAAAGFVLVRLDRKRLSLGAGMALGIAKRPEGGASNLDRRSDWFRKRS